MDWIVTVIVGYVLGSVPVSLLVARRHGVDLERTGDGNPGAWNALEQLGPRRAWPAFVGDALKGLAAGVLGVALGGTYVGYAGVAAAMVGHALPLFNGLRGGKSVMTFAGGMFAVALPAALIALAACALASVVRRSFAVGARIGVFGVVLAQLATDRIEHVAATGALMTTIGALFALRALQARLSARRGTSARATSGRDAAPPT